MLQHREKGHREEALQALVVEVEKFSWKYRKVRIFLLESQKLESFRFSLKGLIGLGKFSEQFQLETFKSSPCLLQFDFSNFVLDFPTVQLSFPTSAKIERPETSRN